ncbi:MAG TPA: DUF6268 family outer membrane beta-barrel protein [Verrucomicrobiae bacterium]|jgi:hypothetical protein
MKKILCAAGLAVLSLLNQSVLAQTGQSPVVSGGENNIDWTGSNAAPWRVNFSSDYSAVAAGRVNFNGVSGNSSAQSADANLTAEVRLNDAWFVPISITSRNFFLGTVPGAPIPSAIDTIGLNLGAGWHINDQWTVAAGAGPRFFRLDAADSTDVGVGAAVRATYKWKPNLTVAMGFAVDPDRDVPVLPLAGARWQILPDLALSLMYPRSGLEYRASSKLRLFAGLDGNFTVFRAANDLGDRIGMSKYNNGLGTYRDFHAGVGAEYRICRGFSASVDGGYSFAREIDYQRIDQTLHFDSAPYIQAVLRMRF